MGERAVAIIISSGTDNSIKTTAMSALQLSLFPFLGEKYDWCLGSRGDCNGIKPGRWIPRRSDGAPRSAAMGKVYVGGQSVSFFFVFLPFLLLLPTTVVVTRCKSKGLQA